jgi:hypothetical protein
MTWAAVTFGDGEFMLNCGGTSSDAERREVDLYITTNDVNDLYERLKDRAEIVEGIHDTFYERRE